MSVEAPTDARLAADDGSGKDTFWEHAEGQMGDVEPDPTDVGPETKAVFTTVDVGRRNLFAARTALTAFTESARTDRVMPRRAPGFLFTDTYIGSDYHIG